MKSETKACQNCKKDFTIEADDFLFYEKIKVPPPTFCPECRRNRRWVWRNERTYYKRKCDAPGHDENIISLYSQDSKHVVYDQNYWWSDEWNVMDYGMEYDFSRPFFDQYRELLSKVPLISLSNTQSINSDYCSSTAWNKDCYLISGSGWNEKVSYANRATKNTDSMDLYIVENSELCYDSLYCRKCYRIFFSYQCEACNNSSFLYNCKNCQNCFCCSNLRGKNYCFFNQQLSKDEYELKIKEINLGNFNNIELIKEKFYEQIYLKSVHRFADIINSSGSPGDYLKNAKNCINCYDFGGDNAENCRYVDWSGFNTKDLYDTGPGAGWGSSLLYEGLDINDSSGIIGSIVCYDSNNCSYCFNVQNSSNLFGCYGLHGKKYCILNKQYSKEEYENIILRIKKHMMDMPYVDSKGRVYKYGEFLPSELSPFAYNETVAQEYFPLSKDQVLEQGYNWKEKEDRNYKIDIKAEEISNDISEVMDDITNEVIECNHKGVCNQQCTGAFKIIPEELQFYRRMNLPIPRLCPNCRHYERLAQRNPMKLWHRSCMKEGCTNTFETSYAPERPEIIYCEKCYQQEVY